MVFQTSNTRNRLQFEKSPYLLQHADNPVDWYPWGEDAFDRARRENKPIFLSIGYSTCHWCHVMAHESFEDPKVAKLMNDAFVSIKVDREERPDIDKLYMTICQLMTGSGGWPLTIVMTPEKNPFFAGTYFPRTSRFGRIGMIDLVPRIQEIWAAEHEKAVQTADQVIEALRQHDGISAQSETVRDTEILDSAYADLVKRYDPEYGGFSKAPKFPTPHQLLFLLREWNRKGDAAILAMVEHTLRAMRWGGMYDQLGFGFHRYSTDAQWLLPHFEKMLYDQALLVLAYTEAYQATGTEGYAETAREILTYVLRDMTSPEGGFYAAEDADSEGVEGKFYLWSIQEIQELLPPEDAALTIHLFHLTPEGNFRDQASGLRSGENILHLRQSFTEIAREAGIPLSQLRQRVAQIRDQLFLAREARVHPHKDDKILTDWNGLMIAALAKAAQVLDEPVYAEAAARAADFLLQTMRRDDGRLLHRYRNGEAGLPAHLDDYAFLTWGLIELYETTFEVKRLEQALALTEDLNKFFWDESSGGFYFTAADHETLPIRQKEIYDGAVPSGNSAAMLNLLRLGRLTATPAFEEQATRLFSAFSGILKRMPSAHTLLLLGVEFGLGPVYEAVIVGDPETDAARAMLLALRRAFLPNKVVVLRPTNEEHPDILRLAGYLGPYAAIDGKPTAYVCRNYVCSLPTTEIEEMLTLFT